MENLGLLLPLLLLIIAVVGIGRGLTENWQDYQLCPYGDVKSGNDPLYFYNYNKYRRPYRWPFRYFSSYPYPHLEPGR
jgi:hypothetical protein